MKKFLLGLLSIVMCFTLVACNNTANNAVPSGGYEAIEEESETVIKEAVEVSEEEVSAAAAE